MGLKGGLVELRRLLGRWLMRFRRVVLDSSCSKGDSRKEYGLLGKLRLDVVLKVRCTGLTVFRRYKYVVR